MELVVFKNMTSLSGQEKFQFLEKVWKPTDLFNSQSIENGKCVSLSCHGLMAEEIAFFLLLQMP